ncbi:MAG: TlpA family protein disulfide reductase [Prevotella sp.]|nr:TlpA family protein disulfide reductase [Prevotella sp.]
MTLKKIALIAIVAISLTGCNASTKQAPAAQAEELTTQPQQEAAATEQTDATAEQAENAGEAVAAPDFTLKDINGKELSLSSLRGKYVILDFWGSWCIWCIKGFPKMKEYYQKYQGKFEILGIDCNESEEKWKAAVEQLQLPWLHVYCPNDNDVLEKYGIQGFPTKILVDPQGNVAKVVMGEDPAFYTFLDQQFK